MSTTIDETAKGQSSVAGWLPRIVAEGYGPGAWHGPDLKAALADVSPGLAFRRPAPGRHNIAEIALHHAYCARNAHARIAGSAAEPFVLEGEDWFSLDDESRLSWERILSVLAREQERLHVLLEDLASGRASSPLSLEERLDLALGVTCHAVYHAGQVQLVKMLVDGQG